MKSEAPVFDQPGKRLLVDRLSPHLVQTLSHILYHCYSPVSSPIIPTHQPLKPPPCKLESVRPPLSTSGHFYNEVFLSQSPYNIFPPSLLPSFFSRLTLAIIFANFYLLPASSLFLPTSFAQSPEFYFALTFRIFLPYSSFASLLSPNAFPFFSSLIIYVSFFFFFFFFAFPPSSYSFFLFFSFTPSSHWLLTSHLLLSSRQR
ncbi:unnamed protein product [Acanthosepion pharaonis]|uniref:Uncharacterized protein n=1 Tax=Acanthosepion pharaonis TaxID=158019 RepID=A0A812DVK2_ACAPH|nr:unnamed protein product [Sepia pharaonis]